MTKKNTLIEGACQAVEPFNTSYRLLQRHYELNGKSQSTIINYGRCLAHMVLHFDCCPSELDTEQVLDYLQYCKNQHNTEPLLIASLNTPCMDFGHCINYTG